MKKPENQLVTLPLRLKTVLTTLFAAAIFVSSCVKDPVSEPASEQNRVFTEKDNPYTITQEEALDNMFDMMDRIYGKWKTNEQICRTLFKNHQCVSCVQS